MADRKVTHPESKMLPGETMWTIAVGDDSITAAYGAPITAAPVAVFVCAHGAGGHMGDRGILQTAELLRSRGIGIVRFNFPYREKGSGRPDQMPLLKETISAVVARTRAEVNPGILVTGGRSMGGRAASMLSADSFNSDGLILLAYPLHPAGKPDKLRDAHLPSITVPVICFNGSRDALCTRELMDAALANVRTKWEMHWVDGADHSFHVLKSSGKTDTGVLAEIADQASSWLQCL